MVSTASDVHSVCIVYKTSVEAIQYRMYIAKPLIYHQCTNCVPLAKYSNRPDIVTATAVVSVDKERKVCKRFQCFGDRQYRVTRYVLDQELDRVTI